MLIFILLGALALVVLSLRMCGVSVLTRGMCTRRCFVVVLWFSVLSMYAFVVGVVGVSVSVSVSVFRLSPILLFSSLSCIIVIVICLLCFL